jgi:hypothetical protein
MDSDGVLVNGAAEAGLRTTRAGVSNYSVDFGFTGPIQQSRLVGESSVARWLALVLTLLATALLSRRRSRRAHARA